MVAYISGLVDHWSNLKDEAMGILGLVYHFSICKDAAMRTSYHCDVRIPK